MDLLDNLHARVLCGDGAMGTMLLNAGVPLTTCFEELCVSAPDRIRRIHEQYIAAGAHVIETNTFGANAVRLARFGFEQRVAEINRAAVRVAQEAAGNKDVILAGSIGPLAIAADEAEAQGVDRAQCFRDQISALLETGVNLIVLETFTRLDEMTLALQVAKEAGAAAVICMFACKPEGRLSCGTCVLDACVSVRASGATLAGLNCICGDDIVRLLEAASGGGALAACPSAGQPVMRRNAGTYTRTPEHMAQITRKLIGRGVRLIGGCCGTTPAHVKAIGAAIAES